ncbi:hypothetical protein ABBQ32_013664 [Trebouxia sp. C0010 RCD-2024]
MQAAELQLLQAEYQRALQEPPWDGYCGLVKVSEDDSVLQPTSRSPGDHVEGISSVHSEPISQQDAVSEPGVGSPLGPAPPGMQYAEQAGNQPAAVTAGYSGDHNDAEQLLLKLESLQIAEGLSAAGTYGQKARIAEDAFVKAVQRLEQGDVPAAINLLKVAHAACPADKPQAQARIVLLLGRCQQMTGPAKPATVPLSATEQPDVHGSSVPKLSHMQPANANGSIGAASDNDRQDESTRKADEAFQCSLEALNRGDLSAAMQQLQTARKLCPRNKPGALVKIQRFISLIESQEKHAAAA